MFLLGCTALRPAPRRRLTALASAAALGLIAAAPAAAAPSASPLSWNGKPGYSYPLKQTEQLGIPGVEAGAAVTPEGAVFTPSVEVLPWNGGSAAGLPARRGLPDARVPLYATAVKAAAGGTAAWWAAEVGGVPSAIIALQPAAGGDAGIALRWGGTADPSARVPRYRFRRPVVPEQAGLYSQPGEPFKAGACWKVEAGAGGSALVKRGDSVVAVVTGLRRAPKQSVPGIKPQACASTPEAWAAELGGETDSGRLHVIVPLQPLAAADPRLAAIAEADVRASGKTLAQQWRTTPAGAAKIELGEPELQRAFEAATVSLLVPRYKLADGTWVQAVNKLQYHAYWIRDAAVMANALDLLGRHTEAKDDADLLRRWQQPDGQYSSRPGQRDGLGQGMWLLGQHVRLTGDAAFAQAWASSVSRAVAWTQSAIDASPVGLLPPSDPKDNELQAGLVTGDSLWAVAGLDAAASLAVAAGDVDLQQRAERARDQLKASVVAMARSTAINGRIRPVLDATGGFSWGELWAAWPYPTFSPTDPLVKSTMAASVADQREGVGTWSAGKYLHLYTGFRTWQTLLRAGDQTTPIKGVYSTLAHLNATYGGFETSVPPFAKRRADSNLAPHGWLSAELVTLIRDLLVREQDGGLVVLGAVPGDWLKKGRETTATDLPTLYGRVNLALRATSTGAELRWSRRPLGGTTAAVNPAKVTFPLPPSITGAKVTGDGTLDGRTVVLSGDGGTVKLKWTGKRKSGPTLAATISKLQRDYKKRKLTPPR